MRETDKSVLIRIAEWTEWIPSRKDENVELNVHNGYTCIPCGQDERLIEVAMSGSGKNKKGKVIDPETGELVENIFGCYVFQATFAQNISSELAKVLMEDQRPVEDMSRDRSKDLLIIKNGTGPNRAQRRGK
jgi:hypothetical protein